MATRIIPSYHLPEPDRLAIIGASSLNPDGAIPPHLLALVEAARQRFIARHGDDGLGVKK